MNKQVDKKQKGIKVAAGKYKRDGYTFDNWNDSPDGTGNSYVSGDIIYGEPGKIETLYAMWTAGRYTITYHTNGGGNNPNNLKTEYTPDDDTFAILSPDEADWPLGYQFGGWYSGTDYKQKVTKVKKGSYGNLDLYAKWVPYTCTVSFDGNGSTKGSMADMTFSYGVSKKLPTNKFSRTGYAFEGWEVIIDGEVIAVKKDKDDFSGIVPRDRYTNNFVQHLIFRAIWGNHFTIDYELYGGVLPVEAIEEYDYGKKISLAVPAKEGFTFGGWFMDENYKTPLKSITAKTSGNLVLHAKWNPFKFTVIYKGNGESSGRMKNQTLYYDQRTTNLAENSFVRKGQEFTGWYASPEATGYHIAYDKANGTFEDKPLETFISESGIFAGGGLKNGAKITLYAGWAGTEYHINYMKYGGNLPAGVDDPGTYRYGEEGFELQEPYKNGDVFLGWYLDPAYKKRIDRITPDTYGDLTLHALWQNNNKKAYTVKFDPDWPAAEGRSGRMSDQKLVYNVSKAITKNNFKVKGYTFLGWNTLPAAGREEDRVDYTDKEVVSGFTAPGADKRIKEYREVVTLYAVWEKDVYSVVLHNVGAPEMKDVVTDFTYGVDQEIVFAGPRLGGSDVKYIGDEGEDTTAATRYLADPCKVGDTFLGWYTDARLKKKATGIKAGSKGNKVFYAKWSATGCTINYDLNAGGDPYARLITDKAGYLTTYGTAYISKYPDKYDGGYVLATAVRKGYGFGGWYREKSCKRAVGNIIGSPYVDMTVYAKWIPNTYMVVFDKNSADATGSTRNMTGIRYDEKRS